MSSNGEFNPFDPTGMFTDMRNASMDAWAKAMVQFVNTDEYAKASGQMLDSWLSNSAPMRKVMEATMKQTLANLSLPSRDDVSALSERLTNIEMRLDDMEALLEKYIKLNTKAQRGRQAKTPSQEK
ncbi:MAG: hypothetical protein RIC55_11295 [Pirellulaceae bacterium]